MNFPLPRLLLPLFASLTLHAALLALTIPRAVPRPAPRIEVRLPQAIDTSADALLKNTFKDAAETKESVPKQADATVRGRARLQAQQLRLAAHVFYPAQAVEQGIEGEVRLRLRLDTQGKLLEARVASSSGHELLDSAALAAAYATGTFPAAGSELILPVVFRLSE